MCPHRVWNGLCVWAAVHHCFNSSAWTSPLFHISQSWDHGGHEQMRRRGHSGRWPEHSSCSFTESDGFLNTWVVIIILTFKDKFHLHRSSPYLRKTETQTGLSLVTVSRIVCCCAGRTGGAFSLSGWNLLRCCSMLVVLLRYFILVLQTLQMA